MKSKIKIEINGNKANVFLLEKNNIIAGLSWTDKRDLSEKLLRKIDLLLKKNNLSIKDISKVDFNCDSPCFSKGKIGKSESDINSAGKCGFTSWQIGEITAKILNFAIKTNKKPES